MRQESWLQQKFNLQEHLVAVASTGVIGVNLQMEKIKKWN